jgi:uncharacterized protein YyaL (SSP411 family)
VKSLIGFVLASFATIAFAKDTAWKSWSDENFAQAKKENKLVILDLEAVWCHWCHVMHEKTYANPEIARTLKENFIQVRVDQDSRPDLASRYEDYGWPATIVFTPDGKEIVKKSGYIPPEEMKVLLAAILKDPSPMPEEKETHVKESTGAVTPELAKEIQTYLLKNYDEKLGGWDISHRFLDADFAELAMSQALRGDADAKRRVLQTLDAQLKIQDPIWGGFYQYSAGGTWDEPHFEKIMSTQADNLRVFAQAFLFTGNEKYLTASKNTADYIDKFLTSPDGAFYTSQDADLVPGKHSGDYFNLNDRARRAKGIPRVDKNIYSRENGWVIQGLTALYAASGDDKYLQRAIKSAKWIQKNRWMPAGGYSHDTADSGGPYLNDNIQMGAAFLRLYAVTGDRDWLDSSLQTLEFIKANFKSKAAGYLSTKTKPGALFPSSISASENIQLARYANLLHHYSGKPFQLEVANGAMKYLANKSIAKSLFVGSGVLLAGYETSNPPAHFTLVGKKSEPKALELWKASLKYPLAYQRTEWWDKSEGPLPKADVQYPDLTKPAVFVCTANRCSLPAFELEAVKKQVDTLKSPKK